MLGMALIYLENPCLLRGRPEHEIEIYVSIALAEAERGSEPRGKQTQTAKIFLRNNTITRPIWF